MKTLQDIGIVRDDDYIRGGSRLLHIARPNVVRIVDTSFIKTNTFTIL